MFSESQMDNLGSIWGSGILLEVPHRQGKDIRIK